MASTLTKAQLEELRRRLERERERILQVLGSAAPAAPQPEQASEFEEDAQRDEEQRHADDVADRERALLADVERALAKLESGRYGVGETSGEAIPYERLAAMPWARDPIGE